MQPSLAARNTRIPLAYGVRHEPYKGNHARFHPCVQPQPIQARGIRGADDRFRAAHGAVLAAVFHANRFQRLGAQAQALHDGLSVLRRAPGRAGRGSGRAQVAPVRPLAGTLRLCRGRCVAGDGGEWVVVDQPQHERRVSGAALRLFNAGCLSVAVAAAARIPQS